MFSSIIRCVNRLIWKVSSNFKTIYIYEDDMVDDNIEEEDDEVDQGELEDEFDEYTMNGGPPASNRLVHTVPAKEPDINAVPLKPALKKPKGMHTNHGQNISSRNPNHGDKNVVEVQITSSR